MLLALARVRQLSSSSGLVGERNPLGVVWHTRAPDDSFMVPKGMGRPAGPEFYTQQDQSGWHHTRQAHSELPPWIAAAASHTERHEAAASRARRKKARRLQRQRSAASKLRYSADDPETAEQREQYAHMYRRARTTARKEAAATWGKVRASQRAERRRAAAAAAARERELTERFGEVRDHLKLSVARQSSLAWA